MPEDGNEEQGKESLVMAKESKLGGHAVSSVWEALVMVKYKALRQDAPRVNRITVNVTSSLSKQGKQEFCHL